MRPTRPLPRYETADRFGGLDVAAANAGIAADPPATVLTIDEAVFERVVEVDLFGGQPCLRWSRAVATS